QHYLRGGDRRQTRFTYCRARRPSHLRTWRC
ncbi:hypothetical protein LINPERHAP2_LOCUS35564, partial [Linum perenne]